MHWDIKGVEKAFPYGIARFQLEQDGEGGTPRKNGEGRGFCCQSSSVLCGESTGRKGEGIGSEWGCLQPGLGPEVRDGLGEEDSW